MRLIDKNESDEKRTYLQHENNIMFHSQTYANYPILKRECYLLYVHSSTYEYNNK